MVERWNAPHRLAALTDDALVSRLAALCAEGHVLTARLIAHLVEVEERRLDLRAACTSMFAFCQRRLGMSEGAAFRRITAARLVKRFPALLPRIERGELHLSTLVLIRPHLDERNVEEMVAAVAGKTQRQVEELLARHAPKPDVPSLIVALGAASNDAGSTLFAGADAPPMPTTPRARIEPLSEARYKVQLTASAELKTKLERASDLMRHRNPRGDLATVIDAAVDLLLAKLEKDRLAKTKAPRQPKPATPIPVSPPPSPPPVIEMALRGLCNLGFAKADARQAVDHVSQRRVANGDALDVQDLLRSAIAALT